MTDIKKKMLEMQDDAQAMHLSQFFKTGKGQYGEGDRFLGIKVPVTRAIAKECWQDISLEDLEELISSEWHEIRLCALLILVQKFKKAKKNEAEQAQYIEYYLSHTEFINNWDLVDLSCYELIGTWLLNRDRSILYNFARHGKSIWEQRIGMVSCMTFVRHHEYKDACAIADILIHHEHDLIHKACGWILREVGKHDESTLHQYLRQKAPDENIARYRMMPRTMLRYAIEKFEEPVRRAYLKGEMEDL